jgi:hypothetical protein
MRPSYTNASRLIHHEDTKDTKFMFFIRVLRVFVVIALNFGDYTL